MVKEEIHAAAGSGKCVKITYDKYEKTARGVLRRTRKRYVVEPYSYRIIDGIEYFFGWDVQEKTIKQFIFSQIAKVALSSVDSAMRFPVEIQ